MTALDCPVTGGSHFPRYTAEMPEGEYECAYCGVTMTRRAGAPPGPVSTGDLTRLNLHPADLLGNEQTRALCAHYLGQEAPVTRATLLKWRTRDFPAPLPCTRAGVELWDARAVRAWVQRWARERPGT